MNQLRSYQHFFPLLILFFTGIGSGFAATITVTNGSNTGAGSLRNAISTATAGDIIVFSGVTTVSLSSGELLINKNLTINGGSGVTITRLSSSAFRIFNIGGGSSVSLNNLTISNGSSDYGGGFNIDANCSVSFNACVIDNNDATQQGGGLYVNGSVTMTNCTVKNNGCSFGPSAAHLTGPTASFTGCTFSGNTNPGTYAILVQSSSQSFSMTN